MEAARVPARRANSGPGENQTGGGGAMRIDASSMRALIVAVGVGGAAAVTGTAAGAQTTLLGIYEQAATNTCINTPACRIDFSAVPRNLKVLMVSCLIDIQTNGVNSLIADFELGQATS